MTLFTFLAFTLFVGFFSWYKVRNDERDSSDGYFLGGRSLTGWVIASSMLLTNISTEHLIGMNGSAYKNGMIIIAWEVTSAIALVIAALYFIPTFIRMGLTTIPQYLEDRYDAMTRTWVAFFLMISFVVTLLPIVLYTGAINLEAIFDITGTFSLSRSAAIWYTVLGIGGIGSLYAIIGGLKAVAYSDMINGIGLLIGGLMIPILALWDIGSGSLWTGLTIVYDHAPQKWNPIGASDSVLPFSTLFTGLIINQLYFWGMNQTIIQRALGAQNLAEAQKGLMITGVYKVLVPLIIVLPGIIGFYYFGDSLYDDQDTIYPLLIKKVLPVGLVGIFAAVVIGAVLSTFNSVLNSAATIWSHGIYQRLINPNATEKQVVGSGKSISIILAIFAIIGAPLVASAPDGLYQLMQQLNGIFFIPIASVMIAGLFWPKISATGAKAGLFVGLSFYIICTFILEVNIHFVHIWGIEFILNMIVMYFVSLQYPRLLKPQKEQTPAVELHQWKYAKPMGWSLIGVTILLYIVLGQAG